MSMTVLHLNILSNEVTIDRLNNGGRDGKKGWCSHPLFEMHADIATRGDVEQAKKAWREGHYKAVAIITDHHREELESAFHLTQNIEHGWEQNPGVYALTPHNRSTSVGDIVEIDGMLHLVAGVGFVELGPRHVIEGEA